QMGIELLEEAGFEVKVHPCVRKVSRFWAGTDEERASAFYEYAMDPALDALWCGRGGYGAVRILDLLGGMASARGKAGRKLLLGYSDATLLLDYTRRKWGWSGLHCDMPGLRSFCGLSRAERGAMLGWARAECVAAPWKKLRFFGEAPEGAVEAELTGGNLS